MKMTKKKVKWSQFAEDITVYMENRKESTNY